MLEGYIMAIDGAHVFPGFRTSVITQLTFQSHRLPFFKCFRGERRKKVRLNRVSKSQLPVHESDTLTIEPPGRGSAYCNHLLWLIGNCVTRMTKKNLYVVNGW